MEWNVLHRTICNAVAMSCLYWWFIGGNRSEVWRPETDKYAQFDSEGFTWQVNHLEDLSTFDFRCVPFGYGLLETPTGIVKKRGKTLQISVSPVEWCLSPDSSRGYATNLRIGSSKFLKTHKRFITNSWATQCVDTRRQGSCVDVEMCSDIITMFFTQDLDYFRSRDLTLTVHPKYQQCVLKDHVLD